MDGGRNGRYPTSDEPSSSTYASSSPRWSSLRKIFGRDTESHFVRQYLQTLTSTILSACLSHARSEEMTASSRVLLWASCEDALEQSEWTCWSMEQPCLEVTLFVRFPLYRVVPGSDAGLAAIQILTAFGHQSIADNHALRSVNRLWDILERGGDVATKFRTRHT